MESFALHFLARTALLGSFVVAACAPSAPPANTPRTVLDSIPRTLLRPVPVPASYRAAVERGTRSETGQPGPQYWQQRVSYRIRASLDPQTRVLRGSERVVLHNRSPAPLPDVYLNLYQNVFSEGVPRNRTAPITGGVTLERVAAGGQPLEVRTPQQLRVTGNAVVTPGYAVQGTLARLLLPRPVAPGDSVVLEIDWRHTVPPTGAFRTAWEDALGGRVFQVAQWYPQVAVFDDIHGWDATPYLGDGEFYLEYGDFDVALTLPAGWLVGATGELQNPQEVLTPEAQRRLASLPADSTVPVVSESDLRAGRITRTGPSSLTWRFRASDVRDFAWAASDRYVWDARKAEVEGRTIPVHAFYRPGAPGWEQAARYGEHATEFFSRLLIPYIYPQITISEGPIYGMEYPQLVFIARPAKAEDLYSVIAHEVGHEWFPMMVGQNEAAYAWMDEGFTTYNEDSARIEFFPERDAFAETRESYLRVAGTEAEVPLMRHTDLVSPYGARGVAAYTKPGTLLRSLRAVVGDSVFAEAMRTYARDWLLKHPTPWDFFSTVERVAGRDLDWFWYPWWFETGTLDIAVAGVEPYEGGVRITLEDRGDIPAPVVVRVTADNGATAEVEIPIAAWTAEERRSATFGLPVPGVAARVEVDPDQLFPDVQRDNNVWTAPGGV